VDAIKVKLNNSIITSGIITVSNWTMVENGSRYLYFFSKRWEIITDKMMPVDGGFKSTEHWQLAAMDENGNTLALFPGCQVKAWIHCKECPKEIETPCYGIKGE